MKSLNARGFYHMPYMYPIEETCENYSPIKGSTKRKGINLSIIYECSKRELDSDKFPSIEESERNSCLFCSNNTFPRRE